MGGLGRADARYHFRMPTISMFFKSLRIQFSTSSLLFPHSQVIFTESPVAAAAADAVAFISVWLSRCVRCVCLLGIYVAFQLDFIPFENFQAKLFVISTITVTHSARISHPAASLPPPRLTVSVPQWLLYTYSLFAQPFPPAIVHLTRWHSQSFHLLCFFRTGTELSYTVPSHGSISAYLYGKLRAAWR